MAWSRQARCDAWATCSPPQASLVELTGANHTQFGDYWDGLDEGFVQRGDHPARISRREQRRLVVEHTHQFITSTPDTRRP